MIQKQRIGAAQWRRQPVKFNHTNVFVTGERLRSEQLTACFSLRRGSPKIDMLAHSNCQEGIAMRWLDCCARYINGY